MEVSSNLRYFPGGTEENHGNVQSWYLVSSPRFKCKLEVLPFEPICLIVLSLYMRCCCLDETVCVVVLVKNCVLQSILVFSCQHLGGGGKVWYDCLLVGTKFLSEKQWMYVREKGSKLVPLSVDYHTCIVPHMPNTWVKDNNLS